MTEAEFLDFLDLYGADPAFWPEPRAAAARARLETSPEARRALEDLREAERILRADRLEEIPFGYLATSFQPSRPRPWGRPALAAAMSAAAALALSAGLLAGSGRRPADEAASALTLALGPQGDPVYAD